VDTGRKNDKNENLKKIYLTLLQYFRQIGESQEKTGCHEEILFAFGLMRRSDSENTAGLHRCKGCLRQKSVKWKKGLKVPVHDANRGSIQLFSPLGVMESVIHAGSRSVVAFRGSCKGCPGTRGSARQPVTRMGGDYGQHGLSGTLPELQRDQRMCKRCKQKGCGKAVL
jgi:hypothetical protein